MIIEFFNNWRFSLFIVVKKNDSNNIIISLYIFYVVLKKSDKIP